MIWLWMALSYFAGALTVIVGWAVMIAQPVPRYMTKEELGALVPLSKAQCAP